MGVLEVTANEATAAQRRVYFFLVGTDGITAATGEAGGQPQISTNGAAFTNTGVGTLTHNGNGQYYADLTQAAVATAGDVIRTRYKSASTAECPGDAVKVVAFDANDAVRMGLTALPNATAGASGGLPTGDASGRVDVGLWRGSQPLTLSSGQVNALAGAISAGAISSSTFALNAITATVIADGAIDRATFAADTGLQSIRSNTAQAGAAGTITLDASASAVDDFYNYQVIFLTGGTGIGQGRIISDYVGSTKVATISPNWATTPDNTTTFAILPFGAIPGATAPTAGEVADAVWDEARSGHVGAGSFGEYAPANVTHWLGTAAATPSTAGVPEVDVTHLVGNNTAAVNLTNFALQLLELNANVTQISGDATAADNAEAFFDGTGYAGTNNVIPTVTTTTTATNVTTVNGLAAGVITAASIATGAIDADALAADAVDEILDEVVEGSLTFRQVLRILLAALANESGGSGTGTITFRDLADTKNRISATVSSGNRTAVTLDGS